MLYIIDDEFPKSLQFSEVLIFKWVNPASRGYIFAVWASGVRKVASADNRSSFYRACARLVTWFASKIIVIPFVKVREFRGNQTCKQLCSRFCFVLALFCYHFAPGFQWFCSTDFLKSSFPRKVYANNCIKASLLCGEHWHYSKRQTQMLQTRWSIYQKPEKCSKKF